MPTPRATLCAFYPYPSRRAMNEAKRLAGSAVTYAVKRGDLVKGPCERCVPSGKRPYFRRVEAHHDDYDKPLDVRWFCRSHHRERDLELARERKAGAASDSVRQDVRAWTHSRSLVSDKSAALTATVTSAVCSELSAQGIGYSELARRIGVSRQMATSWFGGGIRTMKALACLADALDCEIAFSLRPRSAKDEAA